MDMRDTSASVLTAPSNRSIRAGSCGNTIPNPTEIVNTANIRTGSIRMGKMTRTGMAAELGLSRGLTSVMRAHPSCWRIRFRSSRGSGNTSQMAATARARRSRTWPATACSGSLSIACIEATGSIALTSTPPSTARRMTLQGSMAPTRGSIPIA